MKIEEGILYGESPTEDDFVNCAYEIWKNKDNYNLTLDGLLELAYSKNIDVVSLLTKFYNKEEVSNAIDKVLNG